MLCGSTTGGIPGSTSTAPEEVAGGATAADEVVGAVELVEVAVDMPGMSDTSMAEWSITSDGRVSAETLVDVLLAAGAAVSLLEQAALTSPAASRAQMIPGRLTRRE
jgi:hypothetical protein